MIKTLTLVSFIGCCALQLNLFGQAGYLDSTYGTNGITTYSPQYSYGASAAAIQMDDKIVALGVSPEYNFVLERYNTNGAPDSSFGINGVVSTSINSDGLYAAAVLIQPDGKILAIGSARSGLTFFELYRYEPDGTIDSSFGENGSTGAGLQDGNTEAAGAVLQADGKIVVAGTCSIPYTNGGPFTELYRFQPDGTLDGTFGIEGVSESEEGATAMGMNIQPDQKLLVAAATDSGELSLFRIMPDGNFDSTFANNGVQVTPLGGNGEVTSPGTITLQNDGKIVFGGSYLDSLPGRWSNLVRYNTNGSLDNSFGNNGIVFTRVDSIGSEISAVAIQRDGKIVAGGSSAYNTYYSQFTLSTYNPDGSLDDNFGNNGIVTTYIGTYGCNASAMVIQSDQKLVLAGGSATGGGFNNFTLARYFPDTTAYVATEVAETANAGIQLFPNPATDEITIHTTGYLPQLISLYDMNGKMISEEQNNTRIMVSSLQAGMYIVELKSTDGIMRAKFVKL